MRPLGENFFSRNDPKSVPKCSKKHADHFLQIYLGLILSFNGQFFHFYNENSTRYSKNIFFARFKTRQGFF